jgi:propanol-preferring alcohol dehydrogenase
LRFAGDVRRLGIYGFGAAAHIIAQVVVHQGRQVFAFTRPGDKLAQEFARKLGAVWAGGAEEIAPERLDAAIVFAPVGPLVPLALKAIGKGGTVVLGGIHMSDIPAMPYAILWGERRLQSVANLTRQDAVDFLEITKQMSINTRVEPMPLAEANTALNRLRSGNVTGALLLVL